MRPLPTALRLSMRRPVSKPPRPPFGLRAWSPDEKATAVLLDAAGEDHLGLRSVLAQIPSAASLPPHTPIVLLGVAVSRVGFLRRLFGGGTLLVDRATRCTALLASGYVDVGGGVDQSTRADLAWGWAP
jgi:hypothetical protein